AGGGLGAREPRRPGRRARRRRGRVGGQARSQAPADDALREAAAQLVARHLVARDRRTCPRLARALDARRGGADGGAQVPGAGVTEFAELENEWAGIVERRDASAAREFLADDFVLSSTGGVGPS